MMEMSLAEIRAEVERIQQLVLCLPQAERKQAYFGEVDKLPPDLRAAILAATSLTIIMFEEDNGMKTEKWIAWGSGLAGAIALLIIAVCIPNPTPSQERIFYSILAVALAAFAAVTPGLLELKGKWSSLQVRATGALAVFFIVYVFSPASGRTIPAKTVLPDAKQIKASFDPAKSPEEAKP